MRQGLFICILLAFVMILQACNKVDDTVANQGLGQDVMMKAEAEEATTNEIFDPVTESEGDEAVSEPPPLDAIIIDGYDITASVSGTPLKEAFQDYFKIGVGLNGYHRSVDTVHSAAMREIIQYHFNSVTYTNLMKPDYLLDHQQSRTNVQNGLSEPGVSFDDVIAGLEFSKEHGIGMRGHTLVWHNQTPDWFFREGYEASGAYVDRETMLARLESYIKQVLAFVQIEYPGVVYSWDVVNEAIEIVEGHYETETGLNIRTHYGDDLDNLWYVTIGPDYVEKAFEYARKYADPDVALFYNDYNTYQPAKTSRIYDLVAGLKEKGLVDGIGLQDHLGLNYLAFYSILELVE